VIPSAPEDPLLAACYRGIEPFVRLTGSFEGSQLHEQSGSLACLAPLIPLSSIFNSVVFDRNRPEALDQALDAIWPIWEASPIQRWSAWIVEGDEQAEAIARRWGLSIDSRPRAMGVVLADTQPARPNGQVEQRWDMVVAAKLNELAYGVPKGLFGAAQSAARPSGARCFIAMAGDHPAAVVISLPNGEDCAIVWVATDPARQRRGHARAALGAALASAKDDGFATCTLQSSPAGVELYRRAGFRDLGAAINLWQHMRYA
jgi:ribosomal protein S18 acetylase RimI-like enzyme